MNNIYAQYVVHIQQQRVKFNERCNEYKFPVGIPPVQLCCTGIMGTTVGSSKFTDQDYADDAVLFSDCPSKWPYILSSFDEAAHTMGLKF